MPESGCRPRDRSGRCRSGQELAAAVADRLDVDALVARGRIAIIDPEERADPELRPGGTSVWQPSGSGGRSRPGRGSGRLRSPSWGRRRSRSRRRPSRLLAQDERRPAEFVPAARMPSSVRRRMDEDPSMNSQTARMPSSKVSSRLIMAAMSSVGLISPPRISEKWRHLPLKARSTSSSMF